MDHRLPEAVRGHRKAAELYELTDCERCGKPGEARHHRDRNPENNAPENIEVLCLKCHRLEHGREMYLARCVAGKRMNAPYKGVCWHKRTNRWVVQFKHEGVNRTIYRSDDPEEAAVVYDAAVIAFRGHGYTNLIPLDSEGP